MTTRCPLGQAAEPLPPNPSDTACTGGPVLKGPRVYWGWGMSSFSPGWRVASDHLGVPSPTNKDQIPSAVWALRGYHQSPGILGSPCIPPSHTSTTWAFIPRSWVCFPQEILTLGHSLPWLNPHLLGHPPTPGPLPGPHDDSHQYPLLPVAPGLPLPSLCLPAPLEKTFSSLAEPPSPQCSGQCVYPLSQPAHGDTERLAA